MRRFTGMSLTIAAIVSGVVMASPSNAQRYIVNGHVASDAETHYLASQGFTTGEWVVDGWGIGPAHAVQTTRGSNPEVELVRSDR
jgi:hypothetical protein